jgi:LysM repeat protein
MARQYFIQRGDTLGKIAGTFYNDAALYKKLADYNGIINPDQIIPGQVLEIPSKRELLGIVPKPVSADTELAAPNGLDQILNLFGPIFEFIQDDGSLNEQRWHREYFTRARLPFSIPLSWAPSNYVSRLLCHKQIAEVFSETFAAIQSAGLQDVKSYGGCYNFRSKRSSGKLSTHSWGISIDLNPHSNPMGSPGDMHPGIVEIFRNHGFKWGGDWPRRNKDPMHFQFCTGY